MTFEHYAEIALLEHSRLQRLAFNPHGETTMTVTKAYTRLYRDNRQLTAYVEWSDGSRTEGEAAKPLTPKGLHMTALFDRAKREGAPITHEIW